MFGRSLRNYFLTGLGILLPLVITVYVITIVFSLIGGPLGRIFALFHLPPLLATPAGFITTLALIAVVGFIATNVFGRQLLLMIETVLNGLPLAKNVYAPTKQLVEFLFSDKTAAFKRVVLVEYPRKGVYTIGFITGDGIEEIKQKKEADIVSVFLPTTPNPTSGWLVLLPRDEIMLLDMTIEDGLKFVVSGGVLSPSWKPSARSVILD
ncbi:MAG: DUF502 domain-containing protein [bacterium]|nr:DUF502 domain-containing protein [bacterium]MDD4558884.1 DUF502 domain-containing protein [bacterium]